MSNTQIKGTSYGQIVNNNVDSHIKSDQKKNTYTLESGKMVMSMNGGLEYPMMFKEVLAGEYIKEWKVDNITRLITPLVPTLDKVFVQIKAFFVPHTRVWKSAEKILASKNDYNVNFTGRFTLPYYTIPTAQTTYNYFRDSLVARYGMANNAGDTQINPLLMRGYRAIINDYIRNKEYEAAEVEWNDDTVTTNEQAALRAYNISTKVPEASAYYIAPCQTRKGYLTNVFKSINASLANQDTFQTVNFTSSAINQAYIHLDWEQKYKEIKQSILNANKNDWDIIAEMGGTKPVLNDRVQLLGMLDYELNYQQITQSAPEIDSSSPLGTTGSFSYTRADGSLFNHKLFNQHGFIHVLVSISIDKGYEEGTPKELLKTRSDEIYRPTLAKIETQLIRRAEIANVSTISVGQTAAFQPPWAEYKRLPKLVTGEMRSKLLTKLNTTDPDPLTLSQWHNSPTRQNAVTVDGEYFRPRYDTQTVLARNNILTTAGDAATVVQPEMIACMSEHTVTVSSPIQADTIHDVETANSKE